MFAFQDEAVEWMKMRESDPYISGGFLCHEMGLGKTRMMCRLIKENIRPLTLVLTTKSTVESWLSELRNQSKFEFDVRTTKKPFIDPARPCVVVGTHQSVFRLKIPIQPDRIVIDEAHVLRNRKHLFQWTKGALARYRWGLTATPYNNGDRDISAYTEYLYPGLSPTMFPYLMLRKTRAEVYEEGPKLFIRKYIYNFETPEEELLYKFVCKQIEVAEDWIEANRGRVPTHVLNTTVLVLQTRKRQATIHPQIVLDAEKVWRRKNRDANPDVESWKYNVTKFKHILEMVKKDQHENKSTMVVTHFDTELKLLKDTFERNKIHVEVIDGKTPLAKRRRLELQTCRKTVADVLSRTNIACVAGKICDFVSRPMVVLLQIQAGGVGLSMPWIHHVINTSPDWNPFMELQAMYRAYRITTLHDVQVTNMYFKQTIDIEIQQRQKIKLSESLRWTGDSPASIADFISMPIV